MKPSAPDFGDATFGQLAGRALLYLFRAARLQCPECGVSPMFVPLRRTRSWRDWVTPLDGCPRCGYAYEREDGYFLLAIWGVHYFTVAGIGLTGALLAEHFFPEISLPVLLTTSGALTVVVSVSFIRHAKAIYVAIDHYFDPHATQTPPPPAAP